MNQNRRSLTNNALFITLNVVYAKWTMLVLLIGTLVLSWCTGSQGNNHCSFLVKELLVSCCVLFGPL